jgi:predicted anti-sigma-YlaC factor YlaD
MNTRAKLVVTFIAATLGTLALPACSPKTVLVNTVGDALAGESAGWGRDDDPELIRDATPFALKTIESLIQSSPDNTELLLAACSGFTEYSYAFVQSDADYVEATDLARAIALRARARNLYDRARTYGLRGLEARNPGFRSALEANPGKAVAAVKSKANVPLLYWTAAAWGLEISLAKQDAELTVELPLTGLMVHRALALDEGYGGGVLYDFLIAYDGGRPAAAGGSLERARVDLEKALKFSGGSRAAPYVTFAETVSVATQNRGEFVKLLQDALAIDPNRVPEQRLANLIAQKRARWLLGRADELFIE